MTQLQRQTLLRVYLLATTGPIPTIIQAGKLTQFTRYYFWYLSEGYAPYVPLDLKSVDQILSLWDARAR